MLRHRARAFLLSATCISGLLSLGCQGGQTISTIPPGADALSVFDGHILQYTYENGKKFTNTFEGTIRVSDTQRGKLREKVVIRSIGSDMYLIVWSDDNWGMLVQVVDLKNMSIRTAIPLDGGTDVWNGNITAFE